MKTIEQINKELKVIKRKVSKLKLTEEDVISIRKSWIRKLRSGKTKKRIGSLHKKDDTMCCLGVLCDLIHTKYLLISKSILFGDKYSYDRATTKLGRTMMSLSGISQGFVSFKMDDEKVKFFKSKKMKTLENSGYNLKILYGLKHCDLATLNDSTNLTHKSIGEFIAKFQDDLFAPADQTVKEFNKKYQFEISPDGVMIKPKKHLDKTQISV